MGSRGRMVQEMVLLLHPLVVLPAVKASTGISLSAKVRFGTNVGFGTKVRKHQLDVSLPAAATGSLCRAPTPPGAPAAFPAPPRLACVRLQAAAACAAAADIKRLALLLTTDWERCIFLLCLEGLPAHALLCLLLLLGPIKLPAHGFCSQPARRQLW